MSELEQAHDALRRIIAHHVEINCRANRDPRNSHTIALARAGLNLPEAPPPALKQSDRGRAPLPPLAVIPV